MKTAEQRAREFSTMNADIVWLAKAFREVEADVRAELSAPSFKAPEPRKTRGEVVIAEEFDRSGFNTPLKSKIAKLIDAERLDAAKMVLDSPMGLSSEQCLETVKYGKAGQ